VRDADFIQESAPERLELKLELHSKISAAAKPDAIGSSTSGLLPSEFYESATHPERCVVGHPFNPVYLLPLVEVVGGKNTAPEAVQAAMKVYESLGMRPLHVRKEVPGSSPTACSKRCGARRCTWSTTAWRPPAKSTTRSVWRRPALVVHGHLPDLHPGRRRCRHAPLHGAVRPGAAVAVDLPAGAGADRQADRRCGRWHQRAIGRHSISALERYRDDCLLAVLEAVKTTKEKHGMSFQRITPSPGEGLPARPQRS
jgi:carnitine 3-dehydrogenase